MSDYQHPQDINLSGTQRAMTYDADGEPVLRVSVEQYAANASFNGLGIAQAGNFVHKYGYCPDVANGVWTTVQTFGGTPYYPTTAVAVELVSDNAQDTNTTGTGAWTVSITGLDANWDQLTEIVEMNGLNPVTTQNTFIRVYRMRVVSAGSSGREAGLIDATQDSNIVARIDPEFDGATLQCAATVPAGKTAYVVNMTLSAGKANKAGLARFMVRPYGGVFGVQDIIEFFQGSYIAQQPPIPFPIPEKSDFRIDARGEDGTTSCSATITYILIDNPA